MPAISERPSRCCGRPSSGIPATSGSTTTWREVLEKLSRRDDAIRYYTAARSIRPETAHKLAHALEDKGESDEAIAVFRTWPGCGPSNGCTWLPGSCCRPSGRSEEAGKVLDAAIAAHREAIRLKPDDAEAHNNLGNTLTARASSTRRSPSIARRSGSSPTTPWPTSTSATP